MIRKLSVLLCVICMCSFKFAYAEIIDSIIQDSNIGKLTIKGRLPSPGIFTVQILKNNIKNLDGMNSSNVKDYLQTMDIFTSESEEYEINVVLGKNAESGSYVVRINCDGLSQPYEFTYDKYYNVELLQEIFAELKSGTQTEISEILASPSKRETLGLVPDELYSGISSEAKRLLSIDVYNNISGIETVEEFREYFLKKCVLFNIIYASSGSHAAKMLKEYGKEAGFDILPKYELFLNMPEEAKKIVGDKIKGKSIDDQNKSEIFSEAVILAELNTASGAAELHEILNNNKAYFDSRTDKYFLLSDTYAIDTKIISEINSFNTLSKLADRIYELVNELQQKAGGGSGNTGKGDVSSRGGNRASSVSVTVPKNVSSEYNNTINFDDLSEVEWAENEINYLYNKSIVNGKAKGLFYPNDPVKREEFVKMLVLAFDLNAGEEYKFSDVKKTDWYYTYVMSAYQNGIVKGVSDDLFGAGEYITRQDMAVMICRAIKNPPENIRDEHIMGFTDKAQISEYAKDAVAMLRAYGIVSGMEDGSFKPFGNTTRAQAAVIIYRAMNYERGIGS